MRHGCEGTLSSRPDGARYDPSSTDISRNGKHKAAICWGGDRYATVASASFPSPGAEALGIWDRHATLHWTGTPSRTHALKWKRHAGAPGAAEKIPASNNCNVHFRSTSGPGCLFLTADGAQSRAGQGSRPRSPGGYRARRCQPCVKRRARRSCASPPAGSGAGWPRTRRCRR